MKFIDYVTFLYTFVLVNDMEYFFSLRDAGRMKIAITKKIMFS